MMMTERTILLTGAANGIGRACALRFTAEGANVVGADIDGSGLREVYSLVASAGRGKFTPFECDLSRLSGCAQAVEATIATYGQMQVLFHNAGVPGPGGLQVDESDFDRVFDLIVKAGFFLCQYSVPHLEKSENATILFTASTAGVKGSPLSIVYGAAKGAILTLTKNLATALSSKGIRVNSICPGGIDTSFVRTALELSGVDTDSAMEGSLRRIPLGRLGRPEEVASMAAYLVSADATYITGSNFVVDGGLLVS